MVRERKVKGMETRGEGRIPIYVRMAEEIEGAMLRSEYGVGDRLPTEHALAEEHGVNRHTAGQALNHLQSKGLIYRVRGRGSFVRSARIDYRVAEKMSFSDSVNRAGLRPSQKILGVRNVGARGRAAAALGIPPGEPLVAFERIRYAGEIPLVYGTKHLRAELFPGVYELLRGRCSSSRALIRGHYGLEMHRARSTFEVEPAEGDSARYLGIQPGAALLRVESLDTLEDGTPAEWGVTYFRGDATRVQVTLRDVKGDA
ncbi:MAG: GntR family transcriptional regulator [Rubrobacter sp.]|nr:GntR family transcriptional regulator [Rubrobacter sp.]